MFNDSQRCWRDGLEASAVKGILMPQGDSNLRPEPRALEFIHLGCSSGTFLLYLPHRRIEIGPDTNKQRANTSSYKHQANSTP